MHANVTITHYVSQALILVLIKHVFCFLHIYCKDNYNPPVTRLRMSLVFQTEPLRLVSKYHFSFIFYTYRKCTLFLLQFHWVGWESMREEKYQKKTFSKKGFLSWIVIKDWHWYQALHLIQSWGIKESIQQLVRETEKSNSGNLLPSSSRLFHSFDGRQNES